MRKKAQSCFTFFAAQKNFQAPRKEIKNEISRKKSEKTGTKSQGLN